MIRRKSRLKDSSTGLPSLLSSQQLLQKFREKDDEMNDLEVSGLSYSRFSQSSSTSQEYPASGVVWGRDEGETDDVVSAGSEFNSSPFAKRLQMKIRDLDRTKNLSTFKKQTNSMFLILESKHELTSPFQSSSSPFIDTAGLSKLQDLENHTPTKMDQHGLLTNPKTRENAPGGLRVALAKKTEQQAYESSWKTPKRTGSTTPSSSSFAPRGTKSVSASSTSTPRVQRNASVKISLTPAQKFEKKPGTRLSNALENFEFGPLVGKGAFANVYKGVNLRTNQVVAIKQITLDLNKLNVQELMGEIDLLKILKHPNIVKYHGFVKTSQSLNVFLEFCSGGSLRQLYKRLGHGLPEQTIIQYVRAILNGLAYLHDQGVVHRDVKAANVLITESQDIKLADFGVAAQINKATQYESVVGTPNWMAPETVLGGEGICTASDIWSLGATIIELFTTHPPYHELNAMATLHAIGTDDHPPLPKSVSQLAQSFLLECFQKQPGLRKSARLLLKHKWLDKERSVTTSSHKHLLNTSTEPLHKSMNSYSEVTDENANNWEKEFPINHADFNKKILEMSSKAPPSPIQPPALISKSELLSKFSDNWDEEFDVELGNDKVFSNKPNENVPYENLQLQVEDDDVEDPFLDLDVDSFDTNELENQSKMDLLLQKFTKRVEICSGTENEEIYAQLTRITGKMLHLVKKYPVLHDVLVREHGILTIMELLENATELPQHQKLWLHCLSILIYVFESNTAQFENFCLLGGIPMITYFKSTTFNMSIKLQVVRFIKCFSKSDRALSMFISSGGLRILSKFVEEDYDTSPEFPLVAIETIHTMLSKDDLARSKSDLCRILSKYGVVFWFAVVLNRLTKDQDAIRNVHIGYIINIFRYFAQSEARARANIASTDLFKLLIRNYGRLLFEYQLTLLRFFKSMSCVLEVLRLLHSAEILEFLVGLLAQHTPSTTHYKEVINIVCPVLYNCCYLNHSREVELVKLGAVPYLKSLSKINLPFRQFVLPILCEFVYCDTYVREVLHRHNIFNTYLSLLVDPYWQSNALDSILNWNQQHDSQRIHLDQPGTVDCFIAGFLLPKVSNLESTLDNYLKLISGSRHVRESMFRESIIENIVFKMGVFSKNSVILLTLLRILKVLIKSGSTKKSEVYNSICSSDLVDNLKSLQARAGSVLVDELANDIIEIIEGNSK